jgi:predicted RNase H-like nuclease (RuvC/YqgF family)
MDMNKVDGPIIKLDPLQAQIRSFRDEIWGAAEIDRLKQDVKDRDEAIRRLNEALANKDADIAGLERELRLLRRMLQAVVSGD